MHLTDFQMIRPPYESTQEQTLEWLVEAHAMAEKKESFKEELREKLWRVCCKPDQIAKRGHILSDFLHLNWEEMEIYRLNEFPTGKTLEARTKVYSKAVEKIFEQYFPEEAAAPDDLIHVSCTGYVSPSGAQKIVSKRNWGQKTTVTHAYHMGCYGSIPALRMGRGFLNTDETKEKVDIVHTEICSLHTNPSKHEFDQLISQSLFADGFMKYSLTRNSKQPALQIHAIREEIIPNSTQSMSWDVIEWGFQMSLAKEVAVLIARHLEGYLERLCGRSLPPNALYAIHPGGPKILNHIQKLLHLNSKQIAHSFAVLKEYGNMSSATLPHVWSRILADPDIEDKTPIISLAFGPGLSIAGAWMEKRCGS